MERSVIRDGLIPDYAALHREAPRLLLVPAISIRMAQCPMIGMAGTSLVKPGNDASQTSAKGSQFTLAAAYNWPA